MMLPMIPRWKTAVFLLAAAVLSSTSHAADGDFYIKKIIPSNGVLLGSTKPIVIDYKDLFGLKNITGNVVQVQTGLGPILMQMLPSAAPNTVANFLQYVHDDAYAYSMVHRVDKESAFSIIQGGGYRVSFTGGNASGLELVPTRAAITNEYSLPNVRGTVAMAKLGNAPDSATSQWFINLADDTSVFGPSNDGGYTVFARVIGGGMNVADAIGNLSQANVTLALTGFPNATPGANVTVTYLTSNATYPLSGTDNDADGLPDAWEEFFGLNSNDNTGVNSADGDYDGDGLTNLQEYNLGTDPTKPDTDGDGLNDYDERFVYGTDPLNADTDGDGISDGDEVNLYHTNPLNADTDGDGESDLYELFYNSDPNNPHSAVVGFPQLPVVNFNGSVSFNNLIVSQAQEMPLFPLTNNSTAALSMFYQVNPPKQKLITVSFNGSKIILTPRKGATGPVTFALFVQDGAGAQAAEQFTIVLGGPVVSKQPTLTHTVKVGANVNLTVVAKSPSQMQFQWYFKNKPLRNSTHVSYVNLPGLALKSVQKSQAGTYVVTITNRYGTVVSQPVTMVVK